MRERGSALLTAVVAVMVLLFISGIIYSFINNQFKMQTTEEKAIKAYYLADAGTTYGIAKMVKQIKEQNKIDTMTIKPPEPFQGTSYPGSYEVTVSCRIESSSPNFTVYIIRAESSGYYPSKSDSDCITRKLIKEYRIQI